MHLPLSQAAFKQSYKRNQRMLLGLEKWQRHASCFTVLASLISRISSFVTEWSWHLKEMSVAKHSLQSCTEILFVIILTYHNKAKIILTQEHHKHKVVKINAPKCFRYSSPTLCYGSRPTNVCVHEQESSVRQLVCIRWNIGSSLYNWDVQNRLYIYLYMLISFSCIWYIYVCNGYMLCNVCYIHIYAHTHIWGCSESSAFYFIMLAHDGRGRC